MGDQRLLLQRVIEYLDSENWHYELHGERRLDRHFSMDCKLKKCDVMILVTEDEVQTYTVSPLNASEDVYAQVVEFITRANYGMRLGRFEFDYSDGEVRYQTCLSCRGALPSREDLGRVIKKGIIALEQYGDGLLKNMMGFGDPEADIRQIEG